LTNSSPLTLLALGTLLVAPLLDAWLPWNSPILLAAVGGTLPGRTPAAPPTSLADGERGMNRPPAHLPWRA